MVPIPYSIDVFSPEPLRHFRFTNVANSNLPMSKTILILISIDTDNLSEIYSTKP